MVSTDHTIAVVAHVSRADAAERLAAAVAAGYIHYDDGTLGCNASHRNTWSWHAANTTTEWSVTLEDDALPVDGFTGQLSAALAVAPAPIVSIYLGRQRPPQWQDRIALATAEATRVAAHWITGATVLHAVGIAVRTDLLPAMLAHAGHQLPADEAVTAWARHHGHRVAYTWPSLVDHADQPSLVRHRDGDVRLPGRIAWRTGTCSDWTPVAVPL